MVNKNTSTVVIRQYIIKQRVEIKPQNVEDLRISTNVRGGAKGYEIFFASDI